MGLIDRTFKLDVMGEGDDTSLSRDKLWDKMPMLEGQGASKDPQPVALRSVKIPR